eukprot:6725793-Prymnesium_polylepis.1
MDEDMCAEAPGALRPELMPDQRVPRAPQVLVRGRGRLRQPPDARSPAAQPACHGAIGADQ